MTENETNVDEEQVEEQEDVELVRTGTEFARAAYATHGYDPKRDDMFYR